MKNVYGVQNNSYYRTLIFDMLSIGFKKPGEAPKFTTFGVEAVFSSAEYHGLSIVDRVMIGSFTLEDYIARLNGMILLEASDIDGQTKFQTIDGELLTMTADSVTPSYLGYVLFNIIKKWTSETLAGVELVDLTFMEK